MTKEFFSAQFQIYLLTSLSSLTLRLLAFGSGILTYLIPALAVHIDQFTLKVLLVSININQITCLPETCISGESLKLHFDRLNVLILCFYTALQ